VEKVLAHKNRLSLASASEKVGKALEYQIVCLIVQEKLASKWSAKITIKENNPNSVGVVRAMAKSDQRQSCIGKIHRIGFQSQCIARVTSIHQDCI
jgi:hypothetical protein